MEEKLTSGVLSEPFKTAFECGDSIDYKSNPDSDINDRDYVRRLGYEPSMNYDCTITAEGLKGLSLSSYGDWGTFYGSFADEEGIKIFLEMVKQEIVIPWRIQTYRRGNGFVTGFHYNDDTGIWERYDSNEKVWKVADNPYVENKN